MIATKKKKSLKKGTTLIEVIVAVGILSMLALIFAQTFALAAAHIADTRMRSGAVAIALQQMEQLRNLPYDAVAVAGGVPNGTIDPDKQVSLGARTYRVLTDIRYSDDPEDGTVDSVPADPVPTDYKDVRIDVTWGSASQNHRVRLASIFAPPGVELSSGGGTMVLNIFDAEGAPLADATVQISNATTTPPIAVTAFSDAAGRVLVPGAPAASDYAITVSKDGYETVKTYPSYPTSTFYPQDRHLTVTQGALTTQSLESSALSDLTVTVRDPFGGTVAGATLHIVGGRVLGAMPNGDTVYDFDSTESSDGNGAITLNNRAAGTYTVTVADSSYALLVVDDATTPARNTFRVAQGTTPTVAVTVADTTVPSAVIHVKDVSEQAVSGATVRLQNLATGYDATAQTNLYGDVFFPQSVDAPLTNASYALTVSAPGYADNTQSITINGLTTQDVMLTTQ